MRRSTYPHELAPNCIVNLDLSVFAGDTEQGLSAFSILSPGACIVPCIFLAVCKKNGTIRCQASRPTSSSRIRRIMLQGLVESSAVLEILTRRI